MNAFTFVNPTKILFGRGKEAEIASEAGRFGGKVLIHYGGGSVVRSGLLDKIKQQLDAAGIPWTELGGVVPNPRLSLVYEGIRLCREQDVKHILAVGGGSVIDSAKAIAAGVPYAGDVWDFYTGKAVLQEALPVGTVLTIPAAGSEASTGSVITREEGELKRAVNSDLLYPVYSVLNPEYCFTLPAFQVACGVADILAHLMERYFTNVRHVEVTDRLIEGLMKTVIHQVPLVLKNPQNYDAWAEIMWAGTLAHNNLMNQGRIGDWATHEIEHELSGIYDIAHGAGLAVMFPAWMKYVWKHDTARFCQFATRVFDVDADYFHPDAMVHEGILRLEGFYHSIGLATTLPGVGIGADRLEEMAGKATQGDTQTVGQFVKLRKDDILAIYKLAL